MVRKKPMEDVISISPLAFILDCKTVVISALSKRAPINNIPYISPILTQTLAVSGHKTGLIPECNPQIGNALFKRDKFSIQVI